MRKQERSRMLAIISFLAISFFAWGGTRAWSVESATSVGTVNVMERAGQGHSPLLYAPSGCPTLGDDTEDYRRREAASRDLEKFVGGHEVDIFIGGSVVVVLVVVLILIILI